MAKPPAKAEPRKGSPKGDGEPGPVGPGNPPIHSRFKPGQSGNPAGRPRKERNLLKLIETELDTEISLTENGQRQRMSKREALAKRMVNSALQGDPKAVTALIRLLGSGSDTSQTETVIVDAATVASFAQRFVAGEGGEP